MAKLVKHSNGRWYIHYADRTGRSRTLSTRSSKHAVAKQRLAEFHDIRRKPRPSETISITWILDQYLADRTGRVASLDALTHASNAVKAKLGHYLPHQLSRAICRQYATDRTDEGRNNGTIIKELKTLRAALSLAEKENWIEKAPYIEVPPMPAPRSRWLTHDEAEKLLSAAMSDHMHLFLLLAIYTGARKTAILELTWDRVGDGFKTIDYALPGRVHSVKRRAVVPTTRRVQEALSRAFERATTDCVIEYNGKPLRNPQQAWGRLLKRSGIDHCTIHDLRRTCATWLVQAGVPTRKVARMLGDSEQMIERVYGHHAPDYLQDAVAALE